jgi:predicted ATP-dependent endonuclease of OLD family
LTGMNNTGKTVALEALFLLSLSAYPQVALNQLNRLRGYTTLGSSTDLPEAWESLFYNWDQAKEIILEAEEDPNWMIMNGKEQSKPKRVLSIRPLLTINSDDVTESDLETPKNLFDESTGVIEGSELVQRSTQRIRGLIVRTVKPNGQSLEQKITGSSSEVIRTQRLSPNAEKEVAVTLIPARGVSSLEQEAQRYSRLQVERRQGEVLELLKIIDPRLKDLVVIAQERSSTIYGDLGAKQLMPLALMGDGMARTLSIALSMVNSRDGVVLIDEVENGLHYSVLVNLWQLIAQMARQLNVQVFAATHSDECIRAVNEAVQTLGYTQDLKLYRFDLTKEGTRVVDYSTNELNAAIETEQEVR